MSLTALHLLLLALVAPGTALAVTIYDVDFAAPGHVVGAAPPSGSGPVPRDRISGTLPFTNGAGAEVVSAFGVLTEQPVRVTTADACFASCPANLLFQLDDPGLPDLGTYTVAFDLVVGPGTVGNGGAFASFDTPNSLLVRFEADGEIWILEGGIETGPVGVFAIGALLRVELQAAFDDANGELAWDVAVNGERLHANLLSSLPIERFRLGAAANVILSPGSDYDVAYDDVVITTVPEPSLFALLLPALVLCVAVRRRV